MLIVSGDWLATVCAVRADLLVCESSFLANISVAIREFEMVASQKVGHVGIGTKAGTISFPSL